MLVAVLHYSKTTGHTTIASARIARYLARKFSADLIDCRAAMSRPLSSYDIYLFVNSLPIACDFRDEIESVDWKTKVCVWVQNDYAIQQYPRGVDMARWTTVERLACRWKDAYIDWNMIAYEPIAAEPESRIRDAIFYYGAYRQGREKYFRRYFGAGATYPVHVSTTRRNAQSFSSLGPNVVITQLSDDPKLSLPDKLAHWACGLYLEDVYSHSHYCSPATRFYEMLSARMAQIFDASCQWTFRRAGIDIRPYVVKSPAELAALMHNAEEISREQQSWARPYRDLLDNAAADAFTNLLRFV